MPSSPFPRWAAALLLIVLAASAAAQPRFRFDAAPGYLPKQIVPLRYDVTLEVDPRSEHFSGASTTTLEVRQRSAAIELHAHQLSLESASLDGQPLQNEVRAQPRTWRLVRSDGAAVEPGRHRLELRWRGRVGDTGTGLFRVDHVAAGQPLRMLATQLEAIHARELLPCFDEPSFRAVFALTVRAPAGDEVVSNMPVAARRRQGEWVESRFPPTPPMPSYLLSVAVGRFDVLEGRAAGVPLRILTAPGKRAQAEFALRATERLLPYYTRYFGQPYALPRLDQLAVPGVRWGAMEDWGLISYAETLLLFDPARSGADTQRRITDTVAHEVSHQWFGDLVTAASWDEIWLNEAFAQWMAAKASDHFHPEWQLPLLQRPELDETMLEDAGRATRSIRSGPVRETAVEDVFDSITYVKGGAVLSMLEQWLGPETFRRGLASYMAERRLSNATAGDLWHHLGRAAGRDVAVVARTWTDQPGLPVLEVAVRCDGGRTRVDATQTRLLLSAGAADEATLWRIPLRLARGDRVVDVLHAGRRQTHWLPGCSPEPVIVNAGGKGYFRVAYDATTLAALTERFAALPAADRAQIFSDVFALAQAGRLPMAHWMQLLARLPPPRDAATAALWQQADAAIDELDAALAGTPAQQALQAATRRSFAAALRRIGWEARAGGDAFGALRPRLIQRLARFGDAEVLHEARERFDRDDDGSAPLPGEIRGAVLLAVGLQGDGPHLDRMLARMRSAEREEERQLLLRALAVSPDEARVRELLDASIAMAGSSQATELVWLSSYWGRWGELTYAHVVAHWPRYAELAGDKARNLLPWASERAADAESARRLVEDQRRLVGPDGDQTAARMADAIAVRAALREREAAPLAAALADGAAPVPTR